MTGGRGFRTFRSSELSSRQRYRLITSLVIPRPIGWIGTRAGRRTNLAPFSYFNALSAAPMLVGASIGKRRNRDTGELVDKDTLRNIRESGVFSANIVTQRHLEAMVHTSGDWPPETDEFEEAGVEAVDCEVVDAPCVADAPAVLECRLFEIVPLGDAPNTLVIGEVVAVRLSPTAEVDPETLHVDPSSLRPVGRLGLDEYTFLGEVRHVPRPRVGNRGS